MNKPLPQGWEWATLSDIAQWGSGGTPKKSERRYYGGDIPWAVIGDLNDSVVSSCKDSITPDGLAESSCKLVSPGTVLIAMYGSIGKLGIAGIEMATNQAIAFAKPHIDHWFLFFYLWSQRLVLAGAGKGATQKNISQTVLKPWPMPIPPLAEQKRIVGRIEEVLTRLDAVESTLKSLHNRLKILRSAILVDIFHTKRDLPIGWKWARLGQVCKKPQYGWTTKSSRMDGLLYLRTTDISRGSIDWTLVPACVEIPPDVERFLLNDGDIVVSRAGSVGVSYLLRNPPRAVFASYLIRLKANKNVIPEYLALYLKSPAYWEAISENKIGIAIPNVNAKKLADIPIPVPSRMEQQHIIERVESEFLHLDTIEFSVTNGLEQVATLRRSVLAEAFAGRLVPQNPSDEPASVLLKRIATHHPAKPKRRRRARA